MRTFPLATKQLDVCISNPTLRCLGTDLLCCSLWLIIAVQGEASLLKTRAAEKEAKQVVSSSKPTPGNTGGGLVRGGRRKGVGGRRGQKRRGMK